MNNISIDELDNKVKTFTEAINSLMEELEAIDFYNRRSDVINNKSLKDLMIHNRNEEIEHASMLIEWLRRNNSVFNSKLRTYLFTDEPITEVEEDSTKINEKDKEND
jgi:ferritin-like protein